MIDMLIEGLEFLSHSFLTRTQERMDILNKRLFTQPRKTFDDILVGKEIV